MKHVSKIRELRKQVGLTQLHLASLLNVTENTVQNWENGRGDLKWIERTIKLCRLFECNPEDLVELVADEEDSRMNALRDRINNKKGGEHSSNES